MFLQELKKFSKENWWTFLLFFGVLIYIGISGKGDLITIVLLTLGNFLGNLFIMIMQANYTAKKNKIGAIYHVGSTIIFTGMGIYSLVFDGYYQYLIWQICYIIAATKAFTFYNFGKDIKIFNSIFLTILNLILLSLFIYIGLTGFLGLNINISSSSISMGIGFSLVTTGLVSINDKFRYWLNIVGILFIVIGSLNGIYTEFLQNDIKGITIGYFIFPLSVFIIYLKLLPKYIIKNKSEKD